MKPPIFSILSITVTSFVGCLLVDTAVAFDGDKIDYKPLYRNANRSAALWKEQAQQFKETNLRLREMLEESRASQSFEQSTGVSIYEEFYIEIPDNGASTIGYYGGPDIKVNIWWKLGGVNGAVLQVGNDSLHKVYVPASGRALIYRDGDSGDEVYLTNRIASKEKLVLLVRRMVR